MGSVIFGLNFWSTNIRYFFLFCNWILRNGGETAAGPGGNRWKSDAMTVTISELCVMSIAQFQA
jgi:hypothetical protein